MSNVPVFDLQSDNARPNREFLELRDLLLREDGDQEIDEELYEGEEDDEEDDEEGPFESLLRHADEIEAGLWPGWNLDRTRPGVLLWTTPSGRRYESTLDGSSYRPFRGGAGRGARE